MTDEELPGAQVSRGAQGVQGRRAEGQRDSAV